MLCVHLPKPDKHRTKGALLSLKDFSVQISFLFAAQVTLEPVSPQLPRDTASISPPTERSTSQSSFFSPLASLGLTAHGTGSKQGVPAAATVSGSISSRHGHWQQRCTRASGSGNPRQPSSIRKHHTLTSLLRQFLLKSSHLSLASTFATSNLFPHGTFCFIVTTCSHFLNCLGFFMQLGEKKKNHLHLSLSASYFSIWSFLQKFPMRTSLLLLLYIFILPLYTQQNASRPPAAPCHLFSPPASASFRF